MTDRVPQGESWSGQASLPGRVRVGAFNWRMSVRKAELVVTPSGLSLQARRSIETRLAVGLEGLTPADGAVVFPAHPMLSPEGLGIELRGGDCYYFFPADA